MDVLQGTHSYQLRARIICVPALFDCDNLADDLEAGDQVFRVLISLLDLLFVAPFSLLQLRMQEEGAFFLLSKVHFVEQLIAILFDLNGK
ncbi:hypothetical protein D3C80_1467250 [compost metagenome]